MQKHYSVFGILALAIFFQMSFSAAAAETYRVDTDHTYVLFRVKHLNIGYSYGRFHGPSGTFVWDDANPSNGSIRMMVKAENVDTAVDKRDQHIRSADFLNVAEHAVIEFKSNAIKRLTDDTFEVAGDLTLLGRTRPITIKAFQTGVGNDPWGNFRRGFETTFTIKRSEWGMDFMLNGISDEVDLTVSVETIRQ